MTASVTVTRQLCSFGEEGDWSSSETGAGIEEWCSKTKVTVVLYFAQAFISIPFCFTVLNFTLHYIGFSVRLSS